MGLDLRIPLGLMFLSIGLLMAGYGLFTWHDPMYLQSMGQNVNVIWGGIMSLFGLLMLLMARRARTISPASGVSTSHSVGSQRPTESRVHHL